MTTTRPEAAQVEQVEQHAVTTLERLLELYPAARVEPQRGKESPVLTPAYAAVVAASPFCVVSSVGDGGLDQSPRGDAPGFVTVRDERTLVIPDRRGNNRLDTLRNVIADPRVGLLFLVPGLGLELRVRGTAVVSTDPAELAPHAVKGVLPASVLVVSVERVYFQCARAVKRSRLWDNDAHADPSDLPTAGEMTLQAGGFASATEASTYDAALEDRQNATLY